jgi:acyl-CoA thioesterase-1
MRKISIILFLAFAFLPMPALCASEPVRVLFLGDSLTAGYGLAEEEAFPALIEKLASNTNTPIEARNAGVSGDTSAGALRRLNWLLKEKYDVVFIAIGANDGLRGLSLEELEKNLKQIAQQVRAALPKAKIMLAGIKLPLNFGPQYSSDFEELFSRVARAEKLAFLPFLLEGVAGDATLNLPDRLHPNAAGQKKMATHIWAAMINLLQEQ